MFYIPEGLFNFENGDFKEHFLKTFPGIKGLENLSGFEQQEESEPENPIIEINRKIKDRQKTLENEITMEEPTQRKRKSQEETKKSNYRTRQKERLVKLEERIRVLKEQRSDYRLKEACLQTEIQTLNKNLEYFQNFISLAMSLAYRSTSDDNEPQNPPQSNSFEFFEHLERSFN
ncbi:b-zip transcription factor (eurofung)-related [Anaeramoeba ignava]|uniref:B-zip transcription factor (Eurofung)-related n=1 Tax=Anaeramoeba ignava TaxID=1746090 RepID=A0A9Q0LGV0_ANAIG|nr:b-zip transcription factor (eurofung)-related [Anaeramoeba ignava]